jgi:hypothetical protein
VVGGLRVRSTRVGYCDASFIPLPRLLPGAAKPRPPDAVPLHPVARDARPRRRRQDLEILVLRHELRVLRRQTARPRLGPADRALHAAISRVLPRSRWSCFFVRPETLLRWHRRLVAGAWTYPHYPTGRPALDEDVAPLIIRLAREDPRWATSVSKGNYCTWGAGLGINDPSYPPPSWTRSRPASHRWAFLRQQAAGIVACDFFTVDTSGCGGCRCCSSSRWSLGESTSPG